MASSTKGKKSSKAMTSKQMKKVKGGAAAAEAMINLSETAEAQLNVNATMNQPAMSMNPPPSAIMRKR
jgi:hypothetical protein